MTDKSFHASSPTKKKKSEPSRDRSPQTPQRDNTKQNDTPASLLDFNSMTPFPLSMTPFSMLSPGVAMGSTKVPSSRDWMPNFDPNCPTFSVNVFNNRDLTPPMSNFGPNRNKRKDDEMSPLLEFNESDAILDNTMQSCLSANKGYLVKRAGSFPTAPIALMETSLEPPVSMPIKVEPPPNSSSLFHVKIESQHEVSLKEDSNFTASSAELSKNGAKIPNVSFPSSSSAMGSQSIGFSGTSGLDAIITAAGDIDCSPDNISKTVLTEGINKKTLVGLKKVKQPTSPLKSSSTAKEMSPPSSVDKFLKYEIHASLIRSQATSKQEDNKPINCNCKKSKCLKMYCDCFRLTEYCKQGCHCIDCNNLEQYESARQAAVKSIVERNPEAFKPRVTEDPKSNSKGHLTGCHCRKSQCLKKYCECFTGRVPCSSRCRCSDCKNGSELYTADDLARHKLLMSVSESLNSAKRDDPVAFSRVLSPSAVGMRLFEPSSVSSSALQKQVLPELAPKKITSIDTTLPSPPYESMKSPELSILTKITGKYREQPPSARSEHSVNLMQTIIDESPERIGVESLLSPTSESQILASMKDEVVISQPEFKHHSHDSKIAAPASPIRTMLSPSYVPSPRLLELASVCEEMQEQELTSRSQSQVHSRSGSVS